MAKGKEREESERKKTNLVAVTIYHIHSKIRVAEIESHDENGVRKSQ
jgi:hypothetical protein